MIFYFNNIFKLPVNPFRLLLPCSCLLLASCMDGYAPSPTPVDLYGSRGVFVVNEGNFLYGNSSLCYYDYETKTVINDIFYMANAVPLGDVAYSMHIHHGRGYIVVNNSGCIHAVDANTLELRGTITGLVSPRKILFLNSTLGLVSDLYGRAVAIVDFEAMRVVGSIPTGSPLLPFHQHGTEDLVRIGGSIYSNSWSFDSILLVIDAESLTVVDTISVGIQPLSLVADGNNMLWVLNDGGYPGNPFGYESPSLMRINPNTRAIELQLGFPKGTAVSGLDLNPAGDTLYILARHVYAMGIDSPQLPAQPLIPSNGRNLKALGVDPVDGRLLVADAMDFMSEGKVYVYSPTGLAIDTFGVGIIPGGFSFN